MATNGGASLGRPGQLGRVAVGQLADLVLVDTTGLHHLGTDHPVPALALYGRAADVTTVIIDGRIIIEHGELPLGVVDWPAGRPSDRSLP
jgi:5-methylthioadenosine/S-adenosylhomocysteine deaminase